MRRPSTPYRRAALMTLMTAIVCASACERSSPATPVTPQVPPPPAAIVALTSLVVNGPTTLAPGKTAAYTATGGYADGTTRDLTSSAFWSSSDETVLMVTDEGVATARSNGGAVLKVSISSLSQSKSVVIVPEGLFKLTAVVSDQQMAQPIYDVRVEVVDGVSSGLTARTNWDGVAELYGVPETVQVQFSKDGYAPVTQSMHVTANSAPIRIQLAPTTESPVLHGKYRLNITADACAGNGAIPDALKSRSYDAWIWNNGLRYSVELSGAKFELESCRLCGGVRGNVFFGQARWSDAYFTLNEYSLIDWNAAIYPDVVERLADGRLLTISGRAIVSSTADGFAGILDGTFGIYNQLDLVYTESQPVTTCRSASHHIAFIR